MIESMDEAVEALVGLQGAIAAVFGPGAAGQSLLGLLDADKLEHRGFRFTSMLTAHMSIYQMPYANAEPEAQSFVYNAFNRPHGYLSYVVGLYKTWVRHAHKPDGPWPDLRCYVARSLFNTASDEALRFVDGLVLIAALFHRIENIASAHIQMPNDLLRFCLLSQYGIKIIPQQAMMLTPERNFPFTQAHHTFFDILIKTFLKEEFPHVTFA